MAHLRMSVHKVRDKHQLAHQTVLTINLTALSIKPNMILRLNDFSLPVPWQPRFSIFSIFQLYFELKIQIFWTSLPKRLCGKCLCFHTINMTKYLTLVLTLLLFRFYGNTCYDGFYMLLLIFQCTQKWHFSK